MTAEWDGQHPDEGTMHAWIEGELGADESSLVARHVADCAACQASAAEARGLIAGASRIVGLLDDAPAPLMRPATTPTALGDGSLWRAMRVTPARAAIAAVLVVAVGIVLTRDHVAVDSSTMLQEARPVVQTPAAAMSPSVTQRAAEPAASPAQIAASPAPTAASPAAPPPIRRARDTVLASAIARRLAADQPQRAVQAAPGAAPPTPPATVASEERLDARSSAKVAAGRIAERNEMNAANGVAAPVDRLRTMSAAMVAGSGCYRIDAAEAVPVTWEGIPLPAELALASAVASVDARGEHWVVTPNGSANPIGTWRRAGGDTLNLLLRGASATSTAVLAGSGDLKGTLRATPVRPNANPGPALRIVAHPMACRQ